MRMLLGRLGVVWPLMLAAVLRPDGWRRRGAGAGAGDRCCGVADPVEKCDVVGLALALPLVIGPAR